jgi:hypothetical protein
LSANETPTKSWPECSASRTLILGQINPKKLWEREMKPRSQTFRSIPPSPGGTTDTPLYTATGCFARTGTGVNHSYRSAFSPRTTP